MFREVRLQISNNRGTAWYYMPIIDVTVKDDAAYRPKKYDTHPDIQKDWESFIAFSGDKTTKDWVFDALYIDDDVMVWFDPKTYMQLCDRILTAICMVDADNIGNVVLVLKAYHEAFKNNKIAHDPELWLKICRAAETFMTKANAESPNKVLLCINDARLWCVDGLRGTISVVYEIDKREEFVDDYDVNIKYEYNDKGRLNRHDITPDTPTDLIEIDNPIEYKKPTFAAHKSDTHNGIFIMYDRRLDGTDTYVTKVMYYDTDIYADPVNILGKVYYDCDDDYYNAEKDMYEYCSKIGCKFYDLKDLNLYISTIVADEEDFDRKLNLIEYGHRIIRDVNGYNAIYDTIDTEDQI